MRGSGPSVAARGRARALAYMGVMDVAGLLSGCDPREPLAFSVLAALSFLMTEKRVRHLPVLEGVIAGMLDMFPIFGQLKLMRQWAGIVDVVPDSSPIIGESPLPGLFLNCGWGTGGFKATPGSAHVFAWTMAKGEPHPIAAPFSLERFRDGRLIDEAAAAGVAH